MISYWYDANGKLQSSNGQTPAGAPAQGSWASSTDPYTTPVLPVDTNAAQAAYETPVQEAAPVAAPVPEAPATDPWAAIAEAYGLGAPPAVGMPATMTPTQIGPAPQANPSLLDLNQIPQPQAMQMPVSPEITAMAGGQGYAPDILAKMKANAIQGASSAGLQQLSQTKRVLGEAGVRGGAAAAVQGDIARQTGQNQMNATNQIDVGNAQVGNENAKFGIGQETSIGQNNMAAANAMALENASKLYSGMQSNQNASNQTTQMNTGLTFQRQENQANMDNNNQKSQWDELNKRYGQAQNILGSWGAAA